MLVESILFLKWGVVMAKKKYETQFSIYKVDFESSVRYFEDEYSTKISSYLELERYILDMIKTEVSNQRKNKIVSFTDNGFKGLVFKTYHYPAWYGMIDNMIEEEIDLSNTHISYVLSYLKDDNYNNILYDWRSPICSVFYDYETGPCKYLAPEGIISGTLYSKRQYQIKDNKLLAVFDNSLNIDDEVLQEVLANNSSDKMKNVVNTIQKEQNLVIRNLEDKNLIVQGIAGSGKTSVALHRIAFLLYRIDNLSSKDILIFSPNEVFSSYISNVLPELGEENTKETTFSDYLSYFIKEYKSVNK